MLEKRKIFGETMEQQLEHHKPTSSCGEAEIQDAYKKLMAKQQALQLEDEMEDDEDEVMETDPEGM